MTNYIATGITVSFGALTGEILDVDRGNDTVEAQDSTHQLSLEEWREHNAVGALKQAGPFTLLAHWGGTIPAVGTQDTITVTLPSGGTDSNVAILQDAGGFSGKLGQKITTEMTFLSTGAPTHP